MFHFLPSPFIMFPLWDELLFCKHPSFYSARRTVLPSLCRQLNNPCFITNLQLKEQPFLSLPPCSLIVISWSLVSFAAFASSSFGKCTHRTTAPGFILSLVGAGYSPPTPPLLLKTYYHVVLAVLPKHVDITLQARNFPQMPCVLVMWSPRVFNLESPACCTDPCLLCT